MSKVYGFVARRDLEARRPAPPPAWARRPPLSVPAAAVAICLGSLFLWSVAMGVITLLRWVLP